MYTVYKSLLFFKNYSPITETDFFKRLNDIKNGKLAQDLLVQCEAGMSPEDFEKRSKTANFKKAISAIEKVQERPNRDRIVGSLKTTARVFYWLKKHDGTIPWESYAKRYRCLNLPAMDPDKCREQILPCNSVLTRCFGSVLETILFRHDLLSKDNGIFAERLITAVELGVPFHRIQKSLDINLPVAMKVLKEYFPDCSEEWLENLTKTYEKDWEREPKPPKRL